MYNSKNVLAIVPARGGSKGIPLKNLIEVAGKSLIEHTADVIEECSFIDHAVLSTDHPSIKQEGERCGLSVPFLRPNKISGDRIDDMSVLTHALLESEKFFKKSFAYIVYLQPTSPYRNSRQVFACLKHLVTSNFDSVWTLSKTDVKFHPLKQITLNDGKLNFFDPRGKNIVARQQLDQVYHRNGVAYAFTRECILEKQSIITDNSSAILIEEPTINIDTFNDVDLANALFHKGTTDEKSH